MSGNGTYKVIYDISVSEATISCRMSISLRLSPVSVAAGLLPVVEQIHSIKVGGEVNTIRAFASFFWKTDRQTDGPTDG